MIQHYIDDEEKVVIISVSVNVAELKNMLPKPKKKVSIDEMNKVIAKRGSKHK